MLWVKESIDEVLKKQNTNVSAGLSAKEVKSRLEKFGANEFREKKKETIWQKILHHLMEITAIILIVAAAIAAYMAATEGSGWAKVIVILSIVIINIILGIYQESKAEAALDALKKLNSFTTTVIRGGLKQKVDAREIVPGDIVEFDAGDIITADARLIEAAGLCVDESALTGESVPAEKNPAAEITESVPLGDRLNMVYSGCLVTNGRGVAVVVETAMETEMGKIAEMLNSTTKLKTPLQTRLTQLSKRLCAVALLAGFVIFLVGTLAYGESLAEMLLVAISLGVAAVPETLPIIVTMILSHGVHNMVKKNTIIRRIPAVETVGNTSVICSDKTGTLTQNKMTIQRVWHVNAAPKADTDEFSPEEMHMIELMASCSNASIEIHEDEEKVVGDPTELAIIRLLHRKGVTRVEAERMYPRVHELPFDSARKRMTTVHHVDDGYLVVTKGAFDRIPVDWDDNLRKKAAEIHDGFAAQALRVIAISAKKLPEMPDDLSEDFLERGQNLLGIVGMIDPPRLESKEAVRRAKEAGIKTVMITGDHVETAKAIAREIGIYKDGDNALTGTDLNNISDEELFNRVRDVSVYARVSPEDKLRIVRAWEKHGEVICMTGDGVNDAPALKQADVGAAMGITGTEVTKSAADMVITDDNFATIVDAIAEGRTSYGNIRKTVYFLLSVNFAQIFIMLTGVAVGWGAPIVAVQILLINVVADGVPGFFLAFERPDYGLMSRPPLSKNAGIFANRLGHRIAARAATFSVLTLTAFAIGNFAQVASNIAPGREVGVSMAFITLAFASALNIFNIRSDESIFKTGITYNRGVFLSVLFSFGVTILVATVPPIAGVFQVVPLSGAHWLIIIVLTLSLIAVAEVQKVLFKRKMA